MVVGAQEPVLHDLVDGGRLVHGGPDDVVVPEGRCRACVVPHLLAYDPKIRLADQHEHVLNPLQLQKLSF